MGTDDIDLNKSNLNFAAVYTCVDSFGFFMMQLPNIRSNLPNKAKKIYAPMLDLNHRNT